MVKLLRCAGSALEALTNVGEGYGADHAEQNSLENQKEAFSAASSEYLTLLSSIDVRLRRQINALQDAKIIPAEAVTQDSRSGQAAPTGSAMMGGPAPLSKQTRGGRSVITGGGLGSLDVGWLNSRNDHIGRGMEAGLWEEAQKFVENLKQEQQPTEKSAGIEDGQSLYQMSSNVEMQNQDAEMDQS